MPSWMPIAIAVIFVVVVVGFFGAMFTEMATKRKTGRMKAGVPGERPRSSGPARPKERKRASR